MAYVILFLISTGFILFLFVLNIFEKNKQEANLKFIKDQILTSQKTPFINKNGTYYYQAGKKELPQKRAVPKRKVDLESNFEKSEGQKAYYAVLNIELENDPEDYESASYQFESWPEVSKLGYYLFDESFKYVNHRFFDFRKTQLNNSEKYSAFLNDMRPVKMLVAFNMDFLGRAIKADFLRNDYKMSIFNKNFHCLMVEGAPIVAIINSRNNDWKWPTFNELLTKLFFPEEDPEDFDPEIEDDFEEKTRITAKCFLKMR
ncbi:hypothetical protein [Mongoliibacter ruber]|uniref:Uncharacterized protein n=1 Tax=Mongoliibacter ruber TaxID=1750599 RepID=A0A2T0WV24_9BACT|nr:hypothetical protein [Mongoliibacter ruber]PRY90546.1 hypothetical protein CLW00_101208 [Mongoliibacter ruber]